MKRSEYIPFHEVPFGALPSVEGLGEDLNEFGYRTSEFQRTSELALLVIGDETTHAQPGTTSYAQIAGERISKVTGKSLQMWNLGLPGRGIDYITRTLLCSVDVLKPEYVLIHFPPPDRREFFRNDGKRLNYDASMKEASKKGSPAWKKLSTVDKIVLGHINELQNEQDDNANFLKSYKLIETMLDRRGISWGYSCAHQCEPLIHFLIEQGWLNKNKYLGTPLGSEIDHTSIGQAWAEKFAQ